MAKYMIDTKISYCKRKQLNDVIQGTNIELQGLLLLLAGHKQKYLYKCFLTITQKQKTALLFLPFKIFFTFF